MNDHEFDEMLRVSHRAFTEDIEDAVASRSIPRHTPSLRRAVLPRLTPSQLVQRLIVPSERVRVAAGLAFIGICAGIVIFFSTPTDHSSPVAVSPSHAEPGRGCSPCSDSQNLTVREIPVLFYPNSVRMTPEGKKSIVAAAKTIGPGNLVRVVGRTAHVGDARSAREFSLRRARVVADALVRLGVSEQQLVVQGVGFEDTPATAGQEAAGSGRRVDIGIVYGG